MAAVGLYGTSFEVAGSWTRLARLGQVETGGTGSMSGGGPGPDSPESKPGDYSSPGTVTGRGQPSYTPTV